MGIFTQAYMTVLHHGNDNLFFQLVTDWIKLPQDLLFYIFKLFTAAVIASGKQRVVMTTRLYN